MEDELFALAYRLLEQESNHQTRRPRLQFSDEVILLVYLWAVLHDRPTVWACRRRHWPSTWRWLTLPSQPTMSRRLQSLSVVQLLTRLRDRLRQVQLPQSPSLALLHLLDSRPLTVGGFSKDRDARRGYATGGKARGYKSFDLWGTAVVPEELGLGPLNQADAAGALRLLKQASVPLSGYVLADCSYDTNELHTWARSQGAQLLTMRRQPGASLGHRDQDPGRLRSIELLEGPGVFGRGVYRLREQIERCYGNCSSFGGGLQPLPSWVRGPRRVALWLWAKHIFNGLRICLNKGLAA